MEQASNLIHSLIVHNRLIPVNLEVGTAKILGDTDLNLYSTISKINVNITEENQDPDQLKYKPTVTFDVATADLKINELGKLVSDLENEISKGDPLSALPDFPKKDKKKLKDKIYSDNMHMQIKDISSLLSQEVTVDPLIRGYNIINQKNSKLFCKDNNHYAEFHAQAMTLNNSGAPDFKLKANGIDCQIIHDEEKKTNLSLNSKSVEGELSSSSIPTDDKIPFSMIEGKQSAVCKNVSIQLQSDRTKDNIDTNIMSESVTINGSNIISLPGKKLNSSNKNNLPAQTKQINIFSKNNLSHSTDKTKDYKKSSENIKSMAMSINPNLSLPTGILYSQLTKKNHTTGATDVTKFVNAENFTIKNTEIGPAKINSASISLDNHANGQIMVDSAYLNMNQMLKVINLHRKIPWYAKLFLKNKGLTCSLSIPIDTGRINLEKITISKLHLTSEKGSSLFDKFLSQLLNYLILPFLKKHIKFTLSSQPQSNDQSHNVSKREIILGIKATAFNKHINIPIPQSIIDPITNQLSIPALFSKFGIHLLHKKYKYKICNLLQKIKSDSPIEISKNISQLLAFINKHKKTSEYPAIISFTAQQWPLDEISNILDKNTVLTKLTDELHKVIELFSQYEETHKYALFLIFSLHKKISKDQFNQMIGMFSSEAIKNPIALGLYYELTGNLNEAKILYKSLLDDSVNKAVANTHLGIILLKELQEETDSHSITSAMNYLLQGVLDGSAHAQQKLFELTKSQQQTIRDYAHLYSAVWLFKKEKKLDDFLKAIQHIDQITRSSDAHNRLFDLLICRQKNSGLIFHKNTGNKPTNYKKIATKISLGKCEIDSLTHKTAYELGLRMLYSADGVPCDVDLAKRLLIHASRDVHLEMISKLHLKVCDIVTNHEKESL